MTSSAIRIPPRTGAAIGLMTSAPTPLAQSIGAELPGVTLRSPEATYLAWLDCSALDLPCPAGQFFLDHARVGLNAGETFGAPYASFARLNFATSAPILREIVGRGTVLYEKAHRGVDSQGRKRLSRRQKHRPHASARAR